MLKYSQEEHRTGLTSRVFKGKVMNDHERYTKDVFGKSLEYLSRANLGVACMIMKKLREQLKL